jgi:hypothetical protein
VPDVQTQPNTPATGFIDQGCQELLSHPLPARVLFDTYGYFWRLFVNVESWLFVGGELPRPSGSDYDTISFSDKPEILGSLPFHEMSGDYRDRLCSSSIWLVGRDCQEIP